MSGKVADVVVGGGDVGLLTALGIRKKLPEVEVCVVDDFGTDVPQVGKSTYLDIQNVLHRELGIQERRFIEAVKPIWKATVFFRDWSDNDPFHYPFDVANTFERPDWSNSAEHLAHYYDVLRDSPNHQTRCERIVSQGKTPWYYQSDGALDKYAKCVPPQQSALQQLPPDVVSGAGRFTGGRRNHHCRDHRDARRRGA